MWLQISSGRGPDECELAVRLFQKSFQHECHARRIKTKVIETVNGNIKGNLKSTLLTLLLKNKEIILNIAKTVSQKQVKVFSKRRRSHLSFAPNKTAKFLI